jgi:hypothetical protein
LRKWSNEGRNICGPSLDRYCVVKLLHQVVILLRETDNARIKRDHYEASRRRDDQND